MREFVFLEENSKSNSGTILNISELQAISNPNHNSYPFQNKNKIKPLVQTQTNLIANEEVQFILKTNVLGFVKQRWCRPLLKINELICTYMQNIKIKEYANARFLIVLQSSARKDPREGGRGT